MPSPLRIEPIAGYTPAIGRLVGMLSYARSTTVIAVQGLTTEQLDHIHDPDSNSIGALLAHIAAVERSYQVALGLVSCRGGRDQSSGADSVAEGPIVSADRSSSVASNHDTEAPSPKLSEHLGGERLYSFTAQRGALT